MQKIVPHIWMKAAAKDAVSFYTTLFNNAHIVGSVTVQDTPSGTMEMVVLELENFRLNIMSSTPIAKLNASLSLTVVCTTEKEMQSLWDALSQKGVVHVPLQPYDFSKKYGMVSDRFGLAWQLMLEDNALPQQKIGIGLLFSGDGFGRGEEAAKFYTNFFPQSKITELRDDLREDTPDPEAKIQRTSFNLIEQAFVAVNHAIGEASFNEAFSLMVRCQNQKEIDNLWRRLSADSKSESSGWLKDRFGVWWQIVPEQLEETLLYGSEASVAQTLKALATMRKPNLRQLIDL